VAEFGGRGNVAQIVAAVLRVVPGAENPWFFPSVGEYATLLERNGLETRKAWLFDRSTALEGTMQEWLEVFGGPLLAGVPEGRRSSVRDAVADVLRPALLKDGQWWADYRRLRIVACKVVT
jgi:trans-aconitate 2-methyltransferase